MNPLGLYIHVPFCVSKCPYCDFYSLPATEEQIARYTAVLLRALEQTPQRGRRVDTVYFGGGTPNLLGAESLCAVLRAADKVFPFTPDAEITLEANPNTVTLPLLETLRAGGFNRLSMGMQSAQPEELTLLGRIHTPSQTRQAVEYARRAGFENLSLDLMLGIPGQSAASALDSAKICTGLGVEHLSAYMLKVEPDTPYGRDHMEERVMDGDALADLYLALCAYLEERGYPQYEISNFARLGYESRHNLKYWRGEDYLGIGPSAHSLLGGRRFFFPRDLARFLQASRPFDLVVDDGEGDTREEYIMLRLRLTEGLDLAELAARWPDVAIDSLTHRLPPMERAGLLTRIGECVRLTPSGFLVSNAVIARLLEE